MESTHQVITQYPSKLPPTHPPPAASYSAAPYSSADPYSDSPPIVAAGSAEVLRVELFASAPEQVLWVLAVTGLSGEAVYKRIGVAPEAGGEGMSFVLRIFAIVGRELGRVRDTVRHGGLAAKKFRAGVLELSQIGQIAGLSSEIRVT